MEVSVVRREYLHDMTLSDMPPPKPDGRLVSSPVLVLLLLDHRFEEVWSLHYCMGGREITIIR